MLIGIAGMFHWPKLPEPFDLGGATESGAKRAILRMASPVRRRTSKQTEHWLQVNRLSRINCPRVTFTGLLAATTVTMLVTPRFPIMGERSPQEVSGGPSAAIEVSSATTVDPQSHVRAQRSRGAMC
jgi:hypothetical protein